MNYWYEALSDLEKIEREAGLSLDQRIQVAQIKATLAIGQDLNALRLNDHEPFN